MLIEKLLIHTDRLRLEPFCENHLSDQYISWLNDPEVVRYSELRHQKHSTATCLTYLQAMTHSPNYFWAILIKETGKHIGNITAHIDSHHKIADLGILLGDKTVWGNGYGLEAWLGVCHYIFLHINSRKITAGTLSQNIKMINLMKRAQMQRDGRRRSHYLLNNQPVDIEYYCLFNKDYL